MNDDQLTQLNTAIERSYMLLDLEGEALYRTERGAMYAESKQWRAAANDFGRVAEIAQMVDQTEHAAKALVTQGNMLAQGELWDQAHIAYLRGAELYESIEMYLLAAQSLRQVAGYQVWRKMPDQAIETLELAIDLLDAEVPEEAQLLITLYETLTQIYWSVGEFDAAQEVMQEAGDAVGDYAEMGAVSDRQKVMHGLITGQIGLPEAWAQAMPMITEAGWVDRSLGEAIIAYNDSNWDVVVKSTAQSRQFSREAMLTDPENAQPLVRYLLASMLLSDAQDKLGNRVSVLVALLTCRSVLAKRMGEEAGQAIDRVLDSMATRWGADGMAEAVAGYQTYIREHGTLTV